MKISDEIRELSGEAGIYSRACGKLRELADRIDNETVELPRDRDGVPIRVGDTVYLLDGKAYHVKELSILSQTAYPTCEATDGKTYGFLPGGLSHERPDSLGRIAEDLKDWGETEQIAGCPDVHDVIAYFANRIRKLAEREGE